MRVFRGPSPLEGPPPGDSPTVRWGPGLQHPSASHRVWLSHTRGTFHLSPGLHLIFSLLCGLLSWFTTSFSWCTFSRIFLTQKVWYWRSGKLEGVFLLPSCFVDSCSCNTILDQNSYGTCVYVVLRTALGAPLSTVFLSPQCQVCSC